MLELCTLASGSSGNSLLVTDGRTHVLVDAGISCRRICTGLKELGVEPTELAGVLITHEHSDHISGLTTLTKQLRLPVYASPGTGRQLCYRIAFLEELLRPVAPGEGFSVGGLAIESRAKTTWFRQTAKEAFRQPCRHCAYAVPVITAHLSFSVLPYSSLSTTSVKAGPSIRRSSTLPSSFKDRM